MENFPGLIQKLFYALQIRTFANLLVLLTIRYIIAKCVPAVRVNKKKIGFYDL